jgi:ankyrin repeat protein
LAKTKTYHFLGHAALFLTRYISNSQIDPDLFAKLKELFAPKKTYNFTLFMLECLGKSYNPGDTDLDPIGVCKREFSPLHGAAMLDFGDICEWLVNEGCDINQKSPFGTPLECAIFGLNKFFPFNKTGFGEVLESRRTVKALLKAGATCREECTTSTRGFSMSYGAVFSYQMNQGDLKELLAHGMELKSDATARLIKISPKLVKTLVELLDDMQSPQVAPDAKMQLMRFMQSEQITTATCIATTKDTPGYKFYQDLAYIVEFNDVGSLKNLMADPQFTPDIVLPSSIVHLFHLPRRIRSVYVAHLPLDHGFDSTADLTPLIVALKKDMLDIASVLLDHGASTTGFTCRSVQKESRYFTSVLTIAVSKPLFNPVLDQILNLRLKQSSHCNFQVEAPLLLHLASVHNPDSIDILVSHVRDHEHILRYD